MHRFPQVELHLYHQQRPLVDFCKQRGVSVTAYSPLGSPGSKWLSLITGKPLPDLLALDTVKSIAARHNKTAAQVLLRHTVQRGIIVIPKSSKPHRIQENIDVSIGGKCVKRKIPNSPAYETSTRFFISSLKQHIKILFILSVFIKSGSRKSIMWWPVLVVALY